MGVAFVYFESAKYLGSGVVTEGFVIRARRERSGRRNHIDDRQVRLAPSGYLTQQSRPMASLHDRTRACGHHGSDYNKQVVSRRFNEICVGSGPHCTVNVVLSVKGHRRSEPRNGR